MVIDNTAETLAFVPEHSTDSICVKDDSSYCLSDKLDAMDAATAAKAPMSHAHGEYMTEDDAVAAFALAEHTHSGFMSESDAMDAFATTDHTHTGYASATHTHDDLVGLIDALDTTIVGKADASHTHTQAEVAGLVDKLAELDEAIEALQAAGGDDSAGEVTPILTLSMHLGKLDNNSGAESSSSTRICSEPFAVTPGNSYWQVNDNAVNMYVLLYDADELFLEYMGNFASGAEIAVTNANAAYMRLGSLIGNYDLTNNYYIYDQDPAGGGVAEEEGFTQADADLLYAPINHTHDGFAASAHTHAAADITGLPSSVDAYSKTEADARFAAASHIHGEYLTESEAVDAFAGVSHTHTASEITGLPSSVDAYSKTEADNRFATASHAHSGYAAEGHTHSGYAEANHSHTGYAASGHTHTYSDVGAAASNHSHTPASIGAAASSHTHSGYASSSHTHTEYAASGHTHHPANIGALSSSGGTISGALTVMLDSIFNGVLNTQKIQPKDSGSYSIGTDSNRFYSTYLRVNPNVSSDRRRKRDIAALNVDTLAEFVNNLPVVSYNYNDDAADEAKRIGLIAQDIIAVDPGIAQFFVEQSENGFYSIRPADFVFPLIAAVQVLTKRVEELEGK